MPPFHVENDLDTAGFRGVFPIYGGTAPGYGNQAVQNPAAVSR